MALTNKQIEGIINIFSAAFINAENSSERKNIMIEFEDTFGKSISDWKERCAKKIEEKCPTLVADYDSILHRKERTVKTEEYVVRNLEKEDFPQVREILNQAFDLLLTTYDDSKLEKFVDTGFSYVVCAGEEVLGVVLAYSVPDLAVGSIYVDSIAVVENMRGKGLGRLLLKCLARNANKDEMHTVRLMTKREIDAYKIYRHWGFEESQMVHMSKYFLGWR